MNSDVPLWTQLWTARGPALTAAQIDAARAEAATRAVLQEYR